jgi:hypothetical protein
MADLRLDGERLLVQKQPMPGRRVSVLSLELFEEVGHHRPAVCPGGRREPKPLEVAHPSRRSRGVRGGVVLHLVDPVAGGCDRGDMPVDGPDGGFRLGGERDDVAGSQALGRPGIEGNVVRAPGRGLDHRVEGPLEFVRQTLARHTARDDLPWRRRGRRQRLPARTTW